MSNEREKNEKVTSDGVVIDGMYNNLPYTGPALNLKKDDPPTMQPRLVAEVTVDTFMMDNPDDVSKYKKHMGDVGRGWAEISLEKVQWIAGRETWKIFLRLMHRKYIEPEDTARAQASS
jgi:hypothetical protein